MAQTNWRTLRYQIDRWWQNRRHRHLPQIPDLVDVAYDLAAADTARYHMAHMRHVPDHASDLALHAAQCDGLDAGAILEFGVATGRTLRHFARHAPSRIVHGFDSWQGLPESWSWLHPRGSFACAQPRFREPNIRIHSGWFADTLPEWLRTHSDTIRLIHIDSDLYASCRTILDHLEPHLVPGVRIIFDEYCNYPGWQQDEFRAWQEYCDRTGTQYRYTGRVTRHQQVAVEIWAVDTESPGVV